MTVLFRYAGARVPPYNLEMRTTQLVLIASVPLFSLISNASAQDVAKVNPKTITVKLDNDRARVLEATLAPGQKEKMHSHPVSIVYVISGGTMRSHTPDGKTTDTTLKAGETLFRQPLTHWAENIGTTTMRLVVVELKR